MEPEIIVESPEFMMVGEAQYLYQYHTHESFLLCMKDSRTREEADREAFHAESAQYYAMLLHRSGVTPINKVSPEIHVAKQRAWSDLYEERQKTGDRP